MTRFVLFKELVDHLRDRRSVLGSFALAVIGPLMLIAVFKLVLDLQKERPLEVPVIGKEHAPRLISYLEMHGAIIQPAPADVEERVREGDADMVLVIDPSYPHDYARGKSASVQLIIDDSRSDSQKNVRRMERLLMGYSQSLGALRLIARGVSPELAAPLELAEVDLATPEKLAANLLNMVPLFLMLAALVGGMNLAIDTTAGERERGSLEPLLLNPVSRVELVLGKWLATVCMSVAIALVTLLGFALTIGLLPLEDLGMKIAFGLPECVTVLAAVLPLTLFGSSLQMLIATFARTFKEAQTYLSLLNLLPMVPSMFLMINPSDRQWWMLPLPTVAQVTTVVDVMRGEHIPVWHLAVIGGSSLLYSSICVALLVRLLGQERIVFGRA